MAQTALSPTLVQAVGKFTPVVVGVAGGSGTSTTVTVPQFSVILAVIVSGATSTTTAYCATVSNTAYPPTFTVTSASNDLFSYVAYGKARI